jgi:hypothetical protein
MPNQTVTCAAECDVETDKLYSVLAVAGRSDWIDAELFKEAADLSFAVDEMDFQNPMTRLAAFVC